MDHQKSHFVNSSSGIDSHLPKQRPEKKRHPLADATTWVNSLADTASPPSTMHKHSSHPSIPHHSSLHPSGILQNVNPSSSPPTKIEDKRVSAVSSEEARASNRLSQISNTSTNASGKGRRKTHVGPWRLGRTIGKGASGRVRKARHAYTGQDAAIKIVSKKSAEVLRSQSLAFIDAVPQPGRRTIPFGIEREVVIMKMIEHPNIIRLYLVLEYVEGGELFNHISSKNSLPEHEAIRIFRQIIAALAYCHQFNICHRDLKPENILMDRDNNIKIVDFGMAALQPVNKWLETPCGSPHYASPEVIRSTPYRGDKADIWSCGVILFAMLTGFLPFDSHTEDWRDVIAAVLECDYKIPDFLSPDAQDLIWRILQPDPKRRISIRNMWDHPLIQKYAYLDSPSANGVSHIGPPAGLTTQDCGPRIKQLADIDGELLRNLHNLWHGATEDELAQQLMSDEPNHEKIVYSKLLRYREEQLEHYDGPTIENSISDYHHVNPAKKIDRRSSTRASTMLSQAQRRQSQYSLADHHLQSLGRKGSHVVQRHASVAETEKTAESYDPFRPSRSQMLAKSQADHARITVLRQTSQISGREASSRGISKTNVKSPALHPTPEVEDVYSLASSPPAMHSAGASQLQRMLNNHRRMSRGNSRVTMSSVRTGKSGSSQFVARKPASYKRNVSFNHTGRRSVSTGQPRLRSREHQPASKTLQERYVRDQTRAQPQTSSSSPSLSLMRDSPMPDAQPIVRSKKNPAKTAHHLWDPQARTASNWTEDVRKISTELDQLCDTAFNRASVSSSTPTAATPATGNRESQGRYHSSATSFSLFEDPGSEADSRHVKIRMKDASTQAFQDRPLPPPPSMDPMVEDGVASYVNRELAKTRELLKKRNRASYMEPGYLDDVIAHLDRLMQPSNVRLVDEERRAVTDPNTNAGIPRKDTFDEIIEKGNIGFRSASEPTKDRNKRQKTRADKDTIRLVGNGSDGYKPISPIKPLTIRKKSGASSTPSSGSPYQRTPTLPAFPVDDSRAVSQGGDHRSAGLPPIDKSLEPIDESDDFDPSDRTRKFQELKKRSWFRGSRHQSKPSRDTDIGPPPPPAKDNAQTFDSDDVPGPQHANKKHMSATSEDSQTSELKKPGGKPSRFFKAIFTSKRDSKDSGKSSNNNAGSGDYDLDDGVSVESDISSLHNHHHRSHTFQPLEYPAVTLPSHQTGRGTGTTNVLQRKKSKILNKHLSSSAKGAKEDRARDRTLMPPPPPPSMHPSSSSAIKHQSRVIHPQHSNWLARFLGIKPAVQVLCFQVSKLRARKEITAVWREWRRYGMRDVVVDRAAGRVFARVGGDNSLHIPPLSLAAEVHTILHRGRRANLAIARFTQEKGAKSSFERVVRALEGVLRERGLLVEEVERVGEMRGGAGM